MLLAMTLLLASCSLSTGSNEATPQATPEATAASDATSEAVAPATATNAVTPETPSTNSAGTAPRADTATTINGVSVTTLQPGEWQDACGPDEVVELVQRFAKAVTEGNEEALRSLLPDADGTVAREVLLATAPADPVAAADAAVAFAWFSVVDNAGDRSVERTVDDVVAFASAFNASGAQLTINAIEISPPAWFIPGQIEGGAYATLTASDGTETALLGPISIDCSHQTIYLWNLSRQLTPASTD